MNTFKALFIDNGVIKAGEFPEEPEKPVLHPEDYDGLEDYHHQLEAYRFTYNAAKSNAVECENQEEAMSLSWHGRVPESKIIPLPSGWDYRVKERTAQVLTSGPFSGAAFTEKVATLYRTYEQKPHGFCEAPNSNCTMNCCDENGCNERKRVLVEPEEPLNDFLKQRIATAYRMLETGVWEAYPFDGSTREEIEGMRRAYIDVVTFITRKP